VGSQPNFCRKVCLSHFFKITHSCYIAFVATYLLYRDQPTHLLKDRIDLLTPFLADLFNISLLHGLVPSVFERHIVTPLHTYCWCLHTTTCDDSVRPCPSQSLTFALPRSDGPPRLGFRFVTTRLLQRNSYQAAATTLALLQRVMHAAARLVCNLKLRNHVTPSLQALHWLPVKQRIEFKLCLLVHLALNGRAPSYLQDLITPSASVSGRASLRSASNHDLVVQSSRLRLGDRAFSVAGPRTWNCLPTELKIVTDTALFKRELKTYLFTAAYY